MTSFKSLLLFVFVGYSFLSTAAAACDLPVEPQKDIIYVSPGALLSGQEHIFTSNVEVEIHVAEGTIIYGQSEIYKAQNIQVPDVAVVQSGDSVETQLNAVQVEYTIEKKIASKSVKKLQEKVAERVKNTFFACKKQKQSTYLYQDKYSSGIVSSTSSFASHSSCAVVVFNTVVYVLQRESQQYYTSPQFLNCINLKASPLRGPPILKV